MRGNETERGEQEREGVGGWLWGNILNENDSKDEETTMNLK